MFLIDPSQGILRELHPTFSVKWKGRKTVFVSNIGRLHSREETDGSERVGVGLGIDLKGLELE